jgi:hypothetical protein
VLDEYGFRVPGASNQRDRSSSSRAVRFDTFADAVFCVKCYLVRSYSCCLRLLNCKRARTAQSDCRRDLQFESVCRQGARRFRAVAVTRVEAFNLEPCPLDQFV